MKYKYWFNFHEEFPLQISKQCNINMFALSALLNTSEIVMGVTHRFELQWFPTPEF